MRESVLCLGVAAEALQSTHDAWYGSEEAKQSRVGGIALGLVFPASVVETEEHFDVAEAVGCGAKDIAKEEVPEFDRVQSREEDSCTQG